MILLHHHQGYSVREIAKMLGLSLPAAIKLDQRAKNKLKKLIQFTYSQGDDSISLFLESDTSDVQIVRVGNIDAEFYLSSDPDKSNGLVWQSEDGNTFFCITSTLPQDIMLRLAESVQVKK